jgi:hypothetical protein
MLSSRELRFGRCGSMRRGDCNLQIPQARREVPPARNEYPRSLPVGHLSEADEPPCALDGKSEWR